MTQYRKLYADFYGITWDTKEMEVHHIDYDHTNNEIGNLILLPRALHKELHRTYTEMQWCLHNEPTSKGWLKAIAREHLVIGHSLSGSAYEEHLNILAKCSHWCLLKNVKYNTPFGTHIQHITPNTNMFG